MIFKSLRQLSASVTVATSKKTDAVAVGNCTLARFEPSVWRIFPMLCMRSLAVQKMSRLVDIVKEAKWLAPECNGIDYTDPSSREALWDSYYTAPHKRRPDRQRLMVVFVMINSCP